MNKKYIKYFAIGIPLTVVCYGGLVLFLSYPFTLGNVDKAGVFGDSFGVLTALFSGLAFLGIIYTIVQQSEQIDIQKEDLELTRDELKLTREEIKNQNITMRHQNFESTFFQMLRLHNEIVGSIDLRKSDAPHGIISSGRDCFIQFHNEISDNYINWNPSGPENIRIENAYEMFWEQYRTDLGHYFRYLYTIVRFVKMSDVDDKRMYTNIIRAQLSDQELFVIFYNCLCKYGVDEFKPMIEEFAMFNNLPEEYLLHPEHRDMYSHGAYGDGSV